MANDSKKVYRTSQPGGDFNMTGLDREAIAVLILSDVRRESCKQTAILERIDERLKRGGFSLAKRNRK